MNPKQIASLVTKLFIVTNKEKIVFWEQSNTAWNT